ncbi:MAG: glucose-1-phosphate cytidylyltransferase [Paenibacillaceae bacterium]|nr:glucose-1-phosphate cytidylyltransferase [Paenibacillaceae bacterium]
MKVVILAGGFGTRISEETHLKPKPMVEIGGKPILWHIMKIYAHYGFCDFIVCLGYKSEVIKDYFAQYELHLSDVTFDFRNNARTVHRHEVEPWSVTLVDTGLHTMTGGRLKRVAPYIGDRPFLLTYGDGVADIDIGALVDYHFSHGKWATVTAIQPGNRFGMLQVESDADVSRFTEKPAVNEGWINGGFFVMQPEALRFIEGDATMLEKEPLERLAAVRQLKAYRHNGFWQPMDTLRDKNMLEECWESGGAPWKR